MAIASVLLPRTVRAQAPKRRLCIVLAIKPSAEYESALKEFDQALSALGWRRGDNLHVDLFWSAGDQGRDHATSVAKSIVALAPDAILAQSAVVTSALKAATATVPIVFLHVGDPVSSGIVPNLARPDANVTGVTNTTPTLGGKWLQILKDVAPATSRAAMLVFPEARQPDRGFFLAPFQEAARALGVTTTSGEVSDLQGIESVFATLAQSGTPGAVVVTPHAAFANFSKDIVAIAERYKVPTCYPYRYYAAQGGLVSYGVNNAGLFRQAAPYVDRLLRGTRPGDLPVQQPTRFDLVINSRTARSLGLSVPATILAGAGEVID